MDPDEVHERSATMAKAVGDLAEILGSVSDAVIGLRRTFLEAGFETPTAEAMAADYHRVMLRFLLVPQVPKP